MSITDEELCSIRGAYLAVTAQVTDCHSVVLLLVLLLVVMCIVCRWNLSEKGAMCAGGRLCLHACNRYPARNRVIERRRKDARWSGVERRPKQPSARVRGQVAIGSFLHERMTGAQGLGSSEYWWCSCGRGQSRHHLFVECKAWAPKQRGYGRKWAIRGHLSSGCYGMLGR